MSDSRANLGKLVGPSNFRAVEQQSILTARNFSTKERCQECKQLLHSLFIALNPLLVYLCIDKTTSATIAALSLLLLVRWLHLLKADISNSGEKPSLR